MIRAVTATGSTLLPDDMLLFAVQIVKHSNCCDPHNGT
jgi:hypothetical protein